MKWIARLLVFAAAMFLGMAAAAIFSGFGSGGLSNCVITLRGTTDDNGFKTAPLPAGIRVMYSGSGSDSADAEPYLRFVIYNGLSDSISYGARNSDGPSPIIKINGKFLNYRWSGEGYGADSFTVLPETSVEVRVNRDSFQNRPRKTDEITVGFKLIPKFAKESKTYTSEPFLLPDEFRVSMRPIRN